jgi:hypothetical protein
LDHTLKTVELQNKNDPLHFADCSGKTKQLQKDEQGQGHTGRDLQKAYVWDA